MVEWTAIVTRSIGFHAVKAPCNFNVFIQYDTYYQACSMTTTYNCDFYVYDLVKFRPWTRENSYAIKPKNECSNRIIYNDVRQLNSETLA